MITHINCKYVISEYVHDEKLPNQGNWLFDLIISLPLKSLVFLFVDCIKYIIYQKWIFLSFICLCLRCICVYIFICVHMCGHKCGGQKSVLDVFLWLLSTSYIEGRTLIDYKKKKTLLPRKLHRSSFHHPSNTVLTCECYQLRNFRLVSAECLNSRLQSETHLPSHLPSPRNSFYFSVFSHPLSKLSYPHCTFSNP